MTWARHWKQRVGVELARGRARLIRAQMTIVESGEADDQGTTQEFDPAVGAVGPLTEGTRKEGGEREREQERHLAQVMAGGEREQEQERQGRGRQTTSVKARFSARDAQDESG